MTINEYQIAAEVFSSKGILIGILFIILIVLLGLLKLLRKMLTNQITENVADFSDKARIPMVLRKKIKVKINWL